MKILTAGACALVCALAAPATRAEPLGAEPQGTVPAAPPATPLPATVDPAFAGASSGTVIEVELAEAVGSETHKRGDVFAIRLVRAIAVGQQILVPAGTPGQGEVISASKAGMAGKPGELLLAGRYLDYDGQRIPIRALRLGLRGRDNGNATLVASAFGLAPVAVVAFVVKGGAVTVPSGTPALAKLAIDLPLPTAAAPAPAITPEPTAVAPAAVPAPVSPKEEVH